MSGQRTLDQFALGFVEHVVRTYVEPRFRNLPLWDNGLGTLAGGVVRANIPQLAGDQVAANLLEAIGIRQPRVSGSRRASRNRAGQPGQVIDVTGGPV